MKNAYGQLRIGDPLDENNHVGPLIDTDAVKMYQTAIEKVKAALVIYPDEKAAQKELTDLEKLYEQAEKDRKEKEKE